MKVHEFYQQTQARIDQNGERWGQAAFNVLEAALPHVAEPLRGTLDDPFYRVKTRSSLKSWVKSTLATDCAGSIIGVLR